jgi:hypothetical protein
MGRVSGQDVTNGHSDFVKLLYAEHRHIDSNALIKDGRY